MVNKSKDKIVVIVGPTAIGKSELAIKIAQNLNGEIINADSMQVYQEMEIGTAKPTIDEFNKVPHHLFNLVSVKDSFSVADFQKRIKKIVEDVLKRKKLPIIVGGTGFYIKAFIYNYEFDNFDESERVDKFADKSNQELFDYLNSIDPVSTTKIHINNRKRIIRAIEIFEKSGKTKSFLEMNQKLIPSYDAIIVGLTMQRENLYQRINQRVDQMFEKGLVKEAKAIITNAVKNSTALQAIGYKEFIPMFEGLVNQETTKETIKKNTRHYAKRQYTYFNNQLSVNWFKIEEDSFEDILNYIKNELVR